MSRPVTRPLLVSCSDLPLHACPPSPQFSSPEPLLVGSGASGLLLCRRQVEPTEHVWVLLEAQQPHLLSRHTASHWPELWLCLPVVLAVKEGQAPRPLLSTPRGNE